jgi:hypothetical protein
MFRIDPEIYALLLATRPASSLRWSMMIDTKSPAISGDLAGCLGYALATTRGSIRCNEAIARAGLRNAGRA